MQGPYLCGGLRLARDRARGRLELPDTSPGRPGPLPLASSCWLVLDPNPVVSGLAPATPALRRASSHNAIASPAHALRVPWNAMPASCAGSTVGLYLLTRRRPLMLTDC